MFSQLPERRFPKSLIASLGCHCAMLALIVASRPHFIQPSLIAFGNNGRGTSETVVYLGDSGLSQSLKLEIPQVKHQRKLKVIVARTPENPVEAPAESARAGSNFGSSVTGPSNGYESRPAFPVVFPNPSVERSDIPSGVAGDVIVEVTIDEKGNVADTKVLESLGYGLEEKVLEALKNWRFTPATMNGVAIASRQDVHFHFPS